MNFRTGRMVLWLGGAGEKQLDSVVFPNQALNPEGSVTAETTLQEPQAGVSPCMLLYAVRTYVQSSNFPHCSPDWFLG